MGVFSFLSIWAVFVNINYDDGGDDGGGSGGGTDYNSAFFTCKLWCKTKLGELMNEPLKCEED